MANSRLSKSSPLAWGTLIAAIGFLLFFRPIVAFRLYTPLDDLCYATWTGRLLGVSLDTCVGSSYPPGVGLLWMPAGISARVFAWFSGREFLDVLPIFVGLLSYAYWSAALVLLGRILQKTVFCGPLRPAVKAFWSLVILLNVPALYYATHRTSLVHAPEVFLAFLLVHELLNARLGWGWACGVLLALLRMNDVFGLLLPLSVLVARRKTLPRVWVGVGAVVVGVFGAYFLWVGFSAGYHSTNGIKMLRRLGTSRGYKVLFGGDWGLVWTEPLWLFLLGWGAWRWRQLSALARAGWLWMAAEFLICVGWRGNGSDFGYRYLIGSFAGALLVAAEVAREGRGRKVLAAIAIAGAALLTWMNWIYKELPETTPYSIPGNTWTQPELILNSLKALLTPANWALPLRHSPVAALYASAVEPTGPLALQDRLAVGMLWASTLWCLAIATYVTLFLGRRSRRRD